MVRIHIQSLSEVSSQVSTIEYETPFLLKFTLISMDKKPPKNTYKMNMVFRMVLCGIERSELV